MVCKCGHSRKWHLGLNDSRMWHLRLNDRYPSACLHLKAGRYCLCMRYRERGSDGSGN